MEFHPIYSIFFLLYTLSNNLGVASPRPHLSYFKKATNQTMFDVLRGALMWSLPSKCRRHLSPGVFVELHTLNLWHESIFVIMRLMCSCRVLLTLLQNFWGKMGCIPTVFFYSNAIFFFHKASLNVFPVPVAWWTELKLFQKTGKKDP